MKSDFARKLSELHSELGTCSLLIVSKTRTIEEIQTYYDLGHRDFGENRVQELSEKAHALKELCPEIRWHMIGNLQSNKIAMLFKIPNLFAIHSVHDHALVEKLVANDSKLSHDLRIFLQFNTSKEVEKSGFENYQELKSASLLLSKTQHLKLSGLMTMGTLRTHDFEAEAQRCFSELLHLKEKLQSELGTKLQTSMGMSQDYKIALKEGSDWIRIGTRMFPESK
jgi:pyridoxal phosphate enzyme (YggS family)